MAHRLRGRFGYPADDPFRVTFHKDRLDLPLRWRKPRRVFVNSMGDLFHPEVSDESLHMIFHVMSMLPQHTFMILTKRPDRMRSYLMGEIPIPGAAPGYTIKKAGRPHSEILSHVWLGITAENQEQAEKRIPVLLNTPAAVRFVSVEPMLRPVDLTRIRWGRIDTSRWRISGVEAWSLNNTLQSWPADRLNPEKVGIDWVICGAETGLGKRPMRMEWAYDLRDQCKAAGVPFFFKKDSDGNCPDDMPREFPEVD